MIQLDATAFGAKCRTEAEMAEISQACQDMPKATSLPERTRADTRFHFAIRCASGNGLLVRLGVLTGAWGAVTRLYRHRKPNG